MSGWAGQCSGYPRSRKGARRASGKAAVGRTHGRYNARTASDNVTHQGRATKPTPSNDGTRRVGENGLGTTQSTYFLRRS